MLDGTVNGIALAIFGVVMGAILQLVMVLSGQQFARYRHSLRRRKDEGVVDFIRRRAERDAESAMDLPRSSLVAVASFYGLVAMLVSVLIFSPLHMSWIIFLAALLGGFWLLQGVFSLARTGKGPLKTLTLRIW